MLTKKLNFMRKNKHSKRDINSALRDTVRVDSFRDKIREENVKKGIFYPNDPVRVNWELFITM